MHDLVLGLQLKRAQAYHWAVGNYGVAKNAPFNGPAYQWQLRILFWSIPLHRWRPE